MNRKEVLDELISQFYEWQPDDPDFLEESPEVQDEIDSINKMIDDDTVSDIEKIRILSHFNGEWAPDFMEQNDEETLEAASKILKEEG